MKQTSILMVLSLLLLSGIVSASVAQERPPIAGGYTGRAVTDRQVVAAARFAAAEESRRQGVPISIVEIRSAQTQVVAGINYKLQLRVRSGGEIRDAEAVVYQNLQRQYSLSSWHHTNAAEAEAATGGRQVRVYLVALDDKGKRGRKIGCDDSLVPVKRSIKADASPLRAAIEELLSIPHEYEGQLTNSWWGKNLSVQNVSIRGGVATIRITGDLYVAGICDEPRIESQIEATARQFATVKRVKVFVNGSTLAQAIR